MTRAQFRSHQKIRILLKDGMNRKTKMSKRRQRVVDALNHRQTDGVPIDFGGTAVTGMHVTCVAALRDYYGLEKRPVRVHEPYQMLGMIDADLREALGIDVIGIFPRNTMFGFATENWKSWKFHDLEVLVPGDFNVSTDANGDTLIYPEGDMTVAPSGRMPRDGYFFDSIMRQQLLDEERMDPEDNMEEFTPITDQELAHFVLSAENASASGLAVIATFGGTAFGDIALVPAMNLKHPRGIRDITEWYMSTSSRQDYIHKVFQRQCAIAIQNLERIHSAIGNCVDAVFICGTDFGTQTSAFCSVNTFRSLYFPYYKQVNDWIHSHTTWKTFKHSCGSVIRFIPSFIEAGFDILNPVQCSAVGMDPKTLKETFGDRVVFWGGGIDTQKTLPFGTAAEVREQVLQRCEAFSSDGGFVFNSIHNAQAGTPLQNIVAMFDALREFNGNL